MLYLRFVLFTTSFILFCLAFTLSGKSVKIDYGTNVIITKGALNKCYGKIAIVDKPNNKYLVKLLCKHLRFYGGEPYFWFKRGDFMLDTTDRGIDLIYDKCQYRMKRKDYFR